MTRVVGSRLSRKARDREFQKAQQVRDREHQMMTAQMERINMALDQCCRPVQNDLMSIAFARFDIVNQFVEKLQVSHHAAVENMVSLSPSLQAQPDGSMVSASSGRVY